MAAALSPPPRILSCQIFRAEKGKKKKKSGISTRKAPRRAGRWGQLLGLRRRHCLQVCSSGSGARHLRLGVTAALSGSSMPRGCAGGPAWPCRSRRGGAQRRVADRRRAVAVGAAAAPSGGVVRRRRRSERDHEGTAHGGRRKVWWTAG